MKNARHAAAPPRLNAGPRCRIPISHVTLEITLGSFSRVQPTTLMRIQSAFEKAGIRFIDSDAAGVIGVRFAAPKH
jgi:hypothetical protein